ncbi:MAG: phenylacetate--CoA ligase [Chloroflexi bacterium]|nr:phenylacetate--CoA ligase [Chloroflexota bacterium]
MPIWNREMETMPRAKLQKLQLERLKETLERAYQCIPFYRRLLNDARLKPTEVKSLADLNRVGFTTKQDLREHYPFGMLTVPLEQVVRIHASSGTTGKPTVGAYNKHDLAVWAEVMARVYTAAGVTKKDIVHNAYGYGLFTGGLGFHLGAEKIGATVIPMSGGLSKRQITLMEDFGATVLACTPSYALVLAETAHETELDFRSRMKVRVGIFGAEPWTEEMRQQIQERMNLEAFDIYGLTEIIGPGVSIECPEHNGLHIAEDHFLAQLIDSETGETLPNGGTGELVITTLTKEAMPMIRYRTRDRVTLTREKCACGRTVARMSKVQGRTDDMLIVRGVNVFPSQIEEVVLGADGVAPHYLIVLDRPKNELDNLEVWVEASPELWGLGHEAVEHVQARIYRDLQETLGLSARVSVLQPNAIQRSEGKAKRVIDKRELVK